MRKETKPKKEMQFRAGGKEGKVKFNIKNTHVAVKKTDDIGMVSYEKPFRIPGAVSLALEPQGELAPFYADGITYYTSSSNSGYKGDVEFALIPDKYREEILKETVDKNGVMMETVNEEAVEFALLFEIDGDQKSTRFCFYNCTSTRPNVESKTIEDTKEPVTETVTISCGASIDGIVRAKTTKDVSEEVYENWYTEVYDTKKTGA